MRVLRIFTWLGVLLLVAGLASACESTRTQESPGEYIDSSVLTTKVKAALLDDPNVSAIEIEVDTFKNRVVLSGFVDTEAERQRADQVARGVEGVGVVENNIEIK